MKKRNFKTLNLNKKSISNLQLVGGKQSLAIETMTCPDWSCVCTTAGSDCETNAIGCYVSHDCI